jgi:predicted nucleotidyltransferase
MDDILSAMDLTHPYAAVSPSLDGEVLNVLAGTTRGLTGREVALLTGRTSHSGVLSVLNRLTEAGLVKRVPLNLGFLFALNRDHLAAGAVEQLATLRTRLLAEIREALSGWAIAPVHVSLFGSAARGDGGVHSDIDLLVVRPAETDVDDPRWREQLDALGERIERWTGNRAAVLDISEADLPRLMEDDPPIVAELGADAIPLAGLDFSKLLEDR